MLLHFQRNTHLFTAHLWLCCFTLETHSRVWLVAIYRPFYGILVYRIYASFVPKEIFHAVQGTLNWTILAQLDWLSKLNVKHCRYSVGSGNVKMSGVYWIFIGLMEFPINKQVQTSTSIRAIKSWFGCYSFWAFECSFMHVCMCFSVCLCVWVCVCIGVCMLPARRGL